MNESEQAQAVAKIRERTNNNSQVYSVILMLRSIPKETLETHNEFVTLLEIVDSQAQKIRLQTAVIEAYRKPDLADDSNIHEALVALNDFLMEEKP